MTRHRDPHGPPLSAVPDQTSGSADEETPTGAPLFEPSELRPPPPGHSARRALRRRDLQPDASVDGIEVADTARTRLLHILQRLTTTRRQREEAEVEAQLLRRRHITRTNLIAVPSPKGGVGKTTCTYLIADLLASRPKLRVLAVDTNPDFGTLGKLVPDSYRSEHSLTDVINQMDRLRSAAELDPFMTTTPSGAHLLTAPQHPELMEAMTPELYGKLLTFLGRFYHVILLDLGTGLTDPVARFAIQRADQAVVVSQPGYATMSTVLEALDYVLKRLDGHQLTMVLNMAPRRVTTDPLQPHLRRHQISRQVVIPEDPWLRAMLDDGTYSCEQLRFRTRIAIKRLALAVAVQLV